VGSYAKYQSSLKAKQKSLQEALLKVKDLRDFELDPEDLKELLNILKKELKIVDTLIANCVSNASQFVISRKDLHNLSPNHVGTNNLHPTPRELGTSSIDSGGSLQLLHTQSLQYKLEILKD
jgi:hypothetical protein